eukprot:362173-Chlamydomonas_euryale.AAC.1
MMRRQQACYDNVPASMLAVDASWEWATTTRGSSNEQVACRTDACRLRAAWTRRHCGEAFRKLQLCSEGAGTRTSQSVVSSQAVAAVRVRLQGADLQRRASHWVRVGVTGSGPTKGMPVLNTQYTVRVRGPGSGPTKDMPVLSVAGQRGSGRAINIAAGGKCAEHPVEQLVCCLAPQAATVGLLPDAAGCSSWLDAWRHAAATVWARGVVWRHLQPRVRKGQETGD